MEPDIAAAPGFQYDISEAQVRFGQKRLNT